MSVTEEFRDKVAREVPARLQDLEGARIVSESTCETGDSTTPDNLPIIDDPADGPSGLIVATGLHGVGITLSPATGTAVRSILTCEECPFSLEPFTIDRFKSRFGGFRVRPVDATGNPIVVASQFRHVVGS